MHAKRQEIKQHKKSWNFWWQSSKCVNSEIAGWHKMEEKKAVHGDDAALKSQVVFFRVELFSSTAKEGKHRLRAARRLLQVHQTWFSHSLLVGDNDCNSQGLFVELRLDTFLDFFFLLNFTSFGVLFTSVSIPFSHECILTPNICVPLLTQSSSRRLFITLSASSSSSHARDLMKNNMAIVSGPWRRGWIFFAI